MITKPEPTPNAAAGNGKYLIWGLALIGGLGLAALVINLRAPSQPFDIPPATASAASIIAPTNADSAEIRRGEQLAHAACATCHLFPEPNLLDRFSWSFESLPNMATWLGLTRFDYTGYPGGERLRAANHFPNSPAMSFEDWRAICNFYMASAPVNPLPQPARAEFLKLETQFTPVVASYRHALPQTSLVKIDPSAQRLYVGDAATNSLAVLNATGKTVAAIVLESPPVSLNTRSNGIYVTLMGSFAPSDEPEGSLVFLEQPRQGAGTKSQLLQKLLRPVDTVAADLNRDGREDLVVCQYGNFTGRLSCFENLGNGQYREQVILDRAGAVKSYVQDFNGDGRPDVIVLMAQGREGIFLFLNDGKGGFTQETIVEQPPTWGYSSFQIVDFNGDGKWDLLASNGDNGDILEYRPPYKAYHGVRVYLNDGKNHFTESFFFPLNGAYKAIAADFNRDGKMDIAAISFFPNYQETPQESFVYLENQGNLRFTPYTHSLALSGRWITMDVGDLDGDGKPDIVLGANNRGLGIVPKLLADQWETKGSTILILKNNFK